MTQKIKVFDYIAPLDCFIVSPPFAKLMEEYQLSEWTPVVWLGRLFCMDNDFGEHIFDHWTEREEVIKKARELGMVKQVHDNIIFDVIEYNGQEYSEDQLMIVVPDSFTDHGAFCVKCMKKITKAICPDCKEQEVRLTDGPCNSDQLKKKFWTDVFDSLHLDLETIKMKAGGQ